jgi:hypothetical protein
MSSRATWFAARAAGLVALVGALGWSAWAAADEVSVPVQLQVELLAKVVSYDKNFSGRAQGRVRVLVVEKSGSDDSRYVASQVRQAIATRRDLGGLPAEISTLAFTDGATVARRCTADRIAVVYLASGFAGAEILQIVAALDGVSVLTAGAVAKFVPSGIVLGFDLVGGKPKLFVHLDQARRQHVDFSAQMLKLVKTFP